MQGKNTPTAPKPGRRLVMPDGKPATREFTDTMLRSIKAWPDGKRAIYRDTKVVGLTVEVHPTGKKSWVVWGRVRGASAPWYHRLDHGYPEIPLKDARDKAKAVLVAGRTENPNAARRHVEMAGTFGDLVKSFLEDAPNFLAKATEDGWRLLLEHERLARLRALPTRDIGREDLVRVFEDIKKKSLAAGGKGYSANRTFEAVRRVFTWAVEKALIKATPCVGIKKAVQEPRRQRYYTDAELGAIVRALDDSANADAVRLCLWTGARIEMALGATWKEFDLDKGEWLIPADRAGNKSDVPWLVPLVPVAVAMLQARVGKTPFVFAARSGEHGRAWRSQKTMGRIRTASGVADFRPHDIRRTLNTWLASRAGGAEPQPVRDAILGHQPPGLERTYNLHDHAEEKRAALLRWAAHVERVATAEPAKIIGAISPAVS
jgi:integrase